MISEERTLSDVSDTPSPGLRERKKQQTRHRLETAAVAIVDEEGLDRLTIDAISERAEVSPRTFFNYFDSKEDAILGLRTEDGTRALVAEVVADLPSAPLVDNVLEMLMRVSDSAILDHELRERRREVLHRHPELLSRHFGHMGRMLGPLAEGTQALMARDEGVDADATRDPHAEIVMMACGAGLHAAMTELTLTGTDLTTDDAAARVRSRAASLVRETIERLS